MPVLSRSFPLTWPQDNTKACTFISLVVDYVNIRYIKLSKQDVAEMWLLLQWADKDPMLGWCINRLHQLIAIQMETDDVDSHVHSMHHILNELNYLVNYSNPLTPADIFTLVLINPDLHDWVHVVTPLMQQLLSWAEIFQNFVYT